MHEMSQNSGLANPQQCRVATLALSSEAPWLHHSSPAGLVTKVDEICLVRDWSAVPVLAMHRLNTALPRGRRGCGHCTCVPEQFEHSAQMRSSWVFETCQERVA